MLVQISQNSSSLELAEVKEYLNEIDSSKDSEITSILNAVVEDAENITKRKLTNGVFELYIEDFEGFKFPCNPIQEIQKIELLTDDGITYQLLDSPDYYLYEDLGIGKIEFLNTFTIENHKKAIKITFKAGYEVIPPAIVTWIKYKTMCVYDGREETINKYIDSMIEKFRIKEF